MNDMRLHSSQFLKFIIVGGVGTVVNYGVFYALFTYLHTQYPLASTIGFMAGVVIGYPLNKLWTYSHADKTTLGLGARYLGVYLASLCLSLLTLYILVNRLGLDARLANLLVIGLTTCTNFIGTKFLVFRA